MKGKIIFKERQSFVGTWMWYLVIIVSIASIIGTAIAYIYEQDSEGIVGLIIATIVTFGVILLFYTSELHVTIDSSNIYYRYPPFVSSEKALGKDDINKLYVREYKPIWEYGGYGYRFRFRSGRAMSIAGYIGLQLELKNGKRLLIGTQKPELMKQAVKRLKENWETNG